MLVRNDGNNNDKGDSIKKEESKREPRAAPRVYSSYTTRAGQEMSSSRTRQHNIVHNVGI